MAHLITDSDDEFILETYVKHTKIYVPPPFKMSYTDEDAFDKDIREYYKDKTFPGKIETRTRAWYLVSYFNSSMLLHSYSIII